jgi:hypothetical protein
MSWDWRVSLFQKFGAMSADIGDDDEDDASDARIYRVLTKSCVHLFSLYLPSLWKHRKNVTARLKLRF